MRRSLFLALGLALATAHHASVAATPQLFAPMALSIVGAEDDAERLAHEAYVDAMLAEPALQARLDALFQPVLDRLSAPWSEVEAYRARLAATGEMGYTRYVGESGGEEVQLLVARDGRFLRLESVESAGGLAQAELGKQVRQGDWLLIERERSAMNPQAFRQFLQRELVVALMMSAADMAEIEDTTELPLDALLAAWDAHEDLSAGEDIAVRLAEYVEMAIPSEESSQAVGQAPSRMLLMPVPGGQALLPENRLVGLAQSWPGHGPLRVPAWQVLATEAASALARGNDPDSPVHVIVDPLADSMPMALRGLLRTEPVEAAVLAIESLETSDWSPLSGTARIRLDAGTEHGMAKGFELRGLQDASEYRLRVEQVDARESVAVLGYWKFAPDEAPAVPAPGMRFSSRAQVSEHTSCAIDIDFASANRAKILAVRPLQGPEFESDYQLWAEVDIDQGSEHGLRVGDSYYPEGDQWRLGEGRLRRVEARSATLIWRAEIFGLRALAVADETQDPFGSDVSSSPELAEALKLGQAVVNGAWRRAAQDPFIRGIELAQ